MLRLIRRTAGSHAPLFYRKTANASCIITGGAIGAGIGSVIPVLGTAIGAAIGIAVGGVAGLAVDKALKRRYQTRRDTIHPIETVMQPVLQELKPINSCVEKTVINRYNSLHTNEENRFSTHAPSSPRM